MKKYLIKTLLLVAIVFVEATLAHSQSYEVPIKNCSPKELIAFYYFKSLEGTVKYYEESKLVNEQAMKFVESKKLDKNKSMASQLNTKDQLKLNSLLEKVTAYSVRSNIEKVNFRNLALLTYMIQIIQAEDDVKDFLSKDLKAVALLISMISEMESKENNFQSPFYEVKNSNTCNIYTLSQQIQLELSAQINASPDEIKALAKDAPALMEKVNKDKDGLTALNSEERRKYNRMKDVFSKLASFRDKDNRLERLKSAAYVSDLQYENAVAVWEKNLGSISSIDQSLQNKFSSNLKYSNDFNKISRLMSLFEKDFPYQDFYETAARNPAELFKKK